MWPFVRDGIKKFFNDRDFFAAKWDRWVTKVRALLITGGMVSAFYSDQLSAAIGVPEWTQRIKVISILLAGSSLLLRAGDKTPQEVKDMATQMKVDK